MSEADLRESKMWEQVFPGLGIGLLVGLLAGLSISPVVSGLLTTLGGLLAAILGIQPSGENGASRFQVNGMRIGAFGLACVLGVLSGMVLRVKEVLAIPIEKQVTAWTKAGYDLKEAKQYVGYKKTGLRMGENGAVTAEPVTGDFQKSGMSGLFSVLSKVDLCNKVKLGNFGKDRDSSAKRMLTAYHEMNNNEASDPFTPFYKWMGQFATELDSLPVETQFVALKGVEEALCTMQRIK